MKRIILLLAIIASATSIYSQESYTYSFNESDFIIKYSGDTVRIVPTSSTYDNTFEVGQPQLPLVSKRILNPSGKYVSDFTVTVTKRVIATDVVMPGVEEPQIAGQETVAEPTLANKSFMTPVLLNDGDCRHHGYSYSAWEIAPYLYDVTAKKLYFVESVTISTLRSTLSSTAGDGSVTVRPRPDLMDWSDFENTQAQSTYKLSTTHTLGVEFGKERIDYLIVTADSLKDPFTPLVRFKRLKGLRVKVESIENILQMPCEYTQPQEKLKYYLYTLYQNNGLKWCLLGGDDNIIPVRECYIPFFTNHDFFAVDRYYACFEKDFRWNGNNNGIYGETSTTPKYDDNLDLTAEIHLARIPMQTKRQILDWTNKLLKYELNPPRDIDISKTFMFGDSLLKHGDSYNKMKEIQDTLSNKYGVTSDMLFDIYSNIEGYNSISLEAVKEQLNKSYNIVGISTHGDTHLYTIIGEKKIRYSSDDAAKQTNKLAGLIATSSCSTNNFTADRVCLSEAFLRNPSGGAVAYLGGSTLSGITCGNNINKLFIWKIFDDYSHVGFAGLVDKVIEEGFADDIRTRGSGDRGSILGLDAMRGPEMNIYPGKYMDLDITFDGNNIIFPYKKELLSSGIRYSYYSLINPNNTTVGVCEIEDSRAFAEMPKYFFDAMFFGRTYIPLIFLNRQGGTYVLKDKDIDYNLVIRADKVIVGENVTIKPYARLKIVAKNEVEFKYNIECQTNSKIEIDYE